MNSRHDELLNGSAAVLADALRAQTTQRCRAAIVHEVKNSIQSLAASLEIFGKSLTPSPPPQAMLEQCLKLGRQSLGKLEATVQQTLDDLSPAFSEPQPVDLVPILEAVVHFLRNESALRQVKINAQLPAAALARGRAEILRQIFLNLMLDAIDAMTPGGVLTVEVEQEHARSVVRLKDTRTLIDPQRSQPTLSGRSNLEGHPLRQRLSMHVVQLLVSEEGGEARVEEAENNYVVAVVLRR
jgi:two-component system, LuxR family, sensor kinase FixL